LGLLKRKADTKRNYNTANNEDGVNMGIVDLIKNKIEKDIATKEQYYDQSGTNWFQTLFNTGVKGEYLTYKKISNIPGNNKCIANCYLPKGDSGTTEIDLLMVHETGIYVFESKNYSGYIFGIANQKMWTQTLNAGKGKVERHQFYNPIIQNRSHIKHLKELLGTSVPIFSYIVFSDRCEFKGLDVDYEDNVIHRKKLIRKLKIDIQGRPIVLNDNQIHDIYEKLDRLSHFDKSQKKEHVVVLKQESERIDDAVRNGICPRCGGQLVLRTASKGPNAGSQFYGCSNYPKCRFTAKAPNKLRWF